MNLDIDLGMILTLLTIIVSVFFAILAIRTNTKIRRANLLKDFIIHFYESKELSEIFFRIEKGTFKFDQEKFPESEDYHKLNYLIEYFDLIAHYEETGILKIEDIKNIVGYSIMSVNDNAEVKKYFIWVDEYFKDIKVRKPSESLRGLARKLRNESNR